MGIVGLGRMGANIARRLMQHFVDWNEVRVARPHDLLDQVLARLITGMGFAGEDQLHRPPVILQQALQSLEIAEEQRGPFVGGEAAGKADGQGVGIQQVVEPDEVEVRHAPRPQMRKVITAPPRRGGVVVRAAG